MAAPPSKCFLRTCFRWCNDFAETHCYIAGNQPNDLDEHMRTYVAELVNSDWLQDAQNCFVHSWEGLRGQNVLQSDQVPSIDSATYTYDHQDQFASDAIMTGTSLVPDPVHQPPFCLPAPRVWKRLDPEPLNVLVWHGPISFYVTSVKLQSVSIVTVENGGIGLIGRGSISYVTPRVCISFRVGRED